MVEIAYLVPGVGLDTEELERRERIANDLVRDNISVVDTDEGPLSIESSVEEEWSAIGIIRMVQKYKNEYDAFVIGCFGDPGLTAARELTEKPIIGPASVSFHTAVQVADRVSCLTILDSTLPMARRQFHEYGLKEAMASVRVVDAPVLDIDHESNDLKERMIDEGLAAVEEDGAEALVPGCMSLSFMQIHQEIADAVGVPFIDPVTIGLETASMWARHGITQSQKSYPEAPHDKLQHLFE